MAEEKHYLEEELQTAYNFDEIIGENPVLKRVLKQAETVAPTNATVLILGETKTGKELVARALCFERSDRWPPMRRRPSGSQKNHAERHDASPGHISKGFITASGALIGYGHQLKMEIRNLPAFRDWSRSNCPWTIFP